MVRLTYTCPNSGLIIIGGPISERTIVDSYHSTALAHCAACDTYHHPKVSECRIYVTASSKTLRSPRRAS